MFVMDDNLPRDLLLSLTNSDFKTDLNNCKFANPDILSQWKWKKDYCVTKGRLVVERKNNVISERLLCLQTDSVSLEEADNRVVAHIRDTILFRKRPFVMVRTTDSDVLVILFAFMLQFLEYCPQTKLWVDFGTGTHRRMLFVNDCYDHLGEPISLAVSLFHAFSGCDSTAAIIYNYKRSKAILFQGWMSFPRYAELTAAFQRLSWQPSDDTVKDCLLAID